MKNIVTISLIIVVVAVIAILAGAVFLKQPAEQNIQNTAPNQNTTAKLFSVSQVASHNTQSDCWMIIEGKAYNVTGYIPDHPAGPEKVIAFCGKDGTQAFNDVHSQKARNMLSDYYVGTIN